jgi:hypothetical protein
VLAGLVRRGEDFDAAEDALQEALLEALRVWPEHPPRDPRAWLATVATRRLVDARRGEAARHRREEATYAEPRPAAAAEEGDDTLFLLFCRLCRYRHNLHKDPSNFFARLAIKIAKVRGRRTSTAQWPAHLIPRNPADRAVVRAAEAVTLVLRGTFHLDPIPHLMREYVPGRDTELRRTGENLSASIGRLAREDRGTFDRIVAFVREVADTPVRDLAVSESGLGDVMLAVVQHDRMLLIPVLPGRRDATVADAAFDDHVEGRGPHSPGDERRDRCTG